MNGILTIVTRAGVCERYKAGLRVMLKVPKRLWMRSKVNIRPATVSQLYIYEELKKYMDELKGLSMMDLK